MPFRKNCFETCILYFCTCNRKKNITFILYLQSLILWFVLSCNNHMSMFETFKLKKENNNNAVLASALIFNFSAIFKIIFGTTKCIRWKYLKFLLSIYSYLVIKTIKSSQSQNLILCLCFLIPECNTLLHSKLVTRQCEIHCRGDGKCSSYVAKVVYNIIFNFKGL